ncbi:MAG TPA: hypothetical protein VGD88_07655 [Opitutaceae bacterium]
MGILDDTTLTIFCLSVMVLSNGWHLLTSRPLTTPANILLSWVGLFFGLAPYFELYHYYKADSYYLAIYGGVLGLITGAIIFPKYAFSTVIQPPPGAPDMLPSFRVQRILLILICYYLVYAAGNVWRAGSFNISQLYLFDPYVGLDMTDNWTRLTKLTRPIAEATLFILVGIILWSRAKTRLVWIVATCGVFVLANLTAYGGRQGIILLPVVVALLACWRWPRAEKTIIICAVGAAFVGMTFLQLVRHQKLDTLLHDPVDALLSSTGSGGEWNSVGTLADLVHYADTQPVTFWGRVELTGVEIRNWSINWVPRAFWPSKPSDTSFSPRMTMVLYADRMAMETWVRTFTFIGQGYFLFGVSGAFGIGVLYGVSLLLLFGWLRHRVEFYGICAALLYKALIASRNDFGSWIFQALSLVVVALIAFWLMRLGLSKTPALTPDSPDAGPVRQFNKPPQHARR